MTNGNETSTAALARPSAPTWAISVTRSLRLLVWGVLFWLFIDFVSSWYAVGIFGEGKGLPLGLLGIGTDAFRPIALLNSGLPNASAASERIWDCRAALIRLVVFGVASPFLAFRVVDWVMAPFSRNPTALQPLRKD